MTLNVFLVYENIPRRQQSNQPTTHKTLRLSTNPTREWWGDAMMTTMVSVLNHRIRKAAEKRKNFKEKPLFILVIHRYGVLSLSSSSQARDFVDPNCLRFFWRILNYAARQMMLLNDATYAYGSSKWLGWRSVCIARYLTGLEIKWKGSEKCLVNFWWCSSRGKYFQHSCGTQQD